MSKQLVLYPPSQPSLEHELPLWLEQEEEYEFYSSQIYSLETAIWGGQPDENELIEHVHQNQTPNTMSLEEVVKEAKKKTIILIYALLTQTLLMSRQ